MNRQNIAVIIVILAILALIATIFVSAMNETANGTGFVQSTPDNTTNSLKVAPNYGMQDSPNVIQVTQPTSYFQGN